MKDNLNTMPNRLRNAMTDSLIGIISLSTSSQLYNNLNQTEPFKNLAYVGVGVFFIAIIQMLYNIAQYNLEGK